jgi:hypothetical protein
MIDSLAVLTSVLALLFLLRTTEVREQQAEEEDTE